MHPKWYTFLLKSSLLYCVSYLVAGGLAYQLLTKQFYVGANPQFAQYLRSESNPQEWAHATFWLVPGLMLRAVLISAVLYQLMDSFLRRSAIARFSVVFSLLFLLTHLAAAAPSPSNIEGLIYLRPHLVSAFSFWMTQPEMILQTAIYAGGFSWTLMPGFLWSRVVA